MENLITISIIDKLKGIIAEVDTMPQDDKIDCINEARRMLHEISPFKNQPVDYVKWIKAEDVVANDYNPNNVAPPEMKLLELSILEDGYTQPIVTHETEDHHLVIDGFHRNRVGKESLGVRKLLFDYLPVVQIRSEKTDQESRIASTIRHNRARGKHGVEPMTGIVMYLSKKGWTQDKIAKHLGMDPDEVLRFKQITGLTELFKDKEFSKAWTV